MKNNNKNYINKNTKLIWVETPTNPMMNIIDIKSIAELAKEKGFVKKNDMSTKELEAILKEINKK